jgi:hypothetical protein
MRYAHMEVARIKDEELKSQNQYIQWLLESRKAQASRIKELETELAKTKEELQMAKVDLIYLKVAKKLKPSFYE